MSAFPEPDRTAVMALLARYARAFKRWDGNTKLKGEIEAEITADFDQMQLLKTALQVFGFQPTDGKAWINFRDIVGPEDYDAAIQSGMTTAIIRCLPAPAQSPPTLSGTIQSATDGRPIRELALERLKIAGISGIKAKQIREAVEAARGTKIHEKTVGMTLYRLSNEGLARCSGHTWFYVPPKVETQNPGGGTPGLFNEETAKEDEQ